jgi:hypothetical protein
LYQISVKQDAQATPKRREPEGFEPNVAVACVIQNSTTRSLSEVEGFGPLFFRPFFFGKKKGQNESKRKLYLIPKL